jgi:branched-subunit amino acid transport protein AzlD
MIIVVLVFITLRDADFGVAQVVGAFSALAAHLIFKNALITIAFSTTICLLLVAIF